MNDLDILHNQSGRLHPISTSDVSQESLNRLTVLQPTYKLGSPLPGSSNARDRPDDILYEDDQVIIHGEIKDVKRIFVRKYDNDNDTETVLGGWILSDNIDSCMVCSSPFVMLFRTKHHCRSCGNLVCYSCSPDKSIVQGFEKYGPQRCCVQCFWGQEIVQPTHTKVSTYVSRYDSTHRDQSARRSSVGFDMYDIYNSPEDNFEVSLIDQEYLPQYTTPEKTTSNFDESETPRVPGDMSFNMGDVYDDMVISPKSMNGSSELDSESVVSNMSDSHYSGSNDSMSTPGKLTHSHGSAIAMGAFPMTKTKSYSNQITHLPSPYLSSRSPVRVIPISHEIDDSTISSSQSSPKISHRKSVRLEGSDSDDDDHQANAISSYVSSSSSSTLDMIISPSTSIESSLDTERSVPSTSAVLSTPIRVDHEDSQAGCIPASPEYKPQSKDSKPMLASVSIRVREQQDIQKQSKQGRSSLNSSPMNASVHQIESHVPSSTPNSADPTSKLSPIFPSLSPSNAAIATPSTSLDIASQQSEERFFLSGSSTGVPFTTLESVLLAIDEEEKSQTKKVSEDISERQAKQASYQRLQHRLSQQKPFKLKHRATQSARFASDVYSQSVNTPSPHTKKNSIERRKSRVVIPRRRGSSVSSTDESCQPAKITNYLSTSLSEDSKNVCGDGDTFNESSSETKTFVPSDLYTGNHQTSVSSSVAQQVFPRDDALKEIDREARVTSDLSELSQDNGQVDSNNDIKVVLDLNHDNEAMNTPVINLQPDRQPDIATANESSNASQPEPLNSLSVNNSQQDYSVSSLSLPPSHHTSSETSSNIVSHDATFNISNDALPVNDSTIHAELHPSNIGNLPSSTTNPDELPDTIIPSPGFVIKVKQSSLMSSSEAKKWFINVCHHPLMPSTLAADASGSRVTSTGRRPSTQLILGAQMQLQQKMFVYISSIKETKDVRGQEALVVDAVVNSSVCSNMLRVINIVATDASDENDARVLKLLGSIIFVLEGHHHISIDHLSATLPKTKNNYKQHNSQIAANARGSELDTRDSQIGILLDSQDPSFSSSHMCEAVSMREVMAQLRDYQSSCIAGEDSFLPDYPLGGLEDLNVVGDEDRGTFASNELQPLYLPKQIGSNSTNDSGSGAKPAKRKSIFASLFEPEPAYKPSQDQQSSSRDYSIDIPSSLSSAMFSHVLASGEHVLQSGVVGKRNPFGLLQTRLLLLTDSPALMYLDPKTLELKGEAKISGGTAKKTAMHSFDVSCLDRTYHFVDKVLGAEGWVGKINDAISRQRDNRIPHI